MHTQTLALSKFVNKKCRKRISFHNNHSVLSCDKMHLPLELLKRTRPQGLQAHYNVCWFIFFVRFHFCCHLLRQIMKRFLRGSRYLSCTFTYAHIYTTRKRGHITWANEKCNNKQFNCWLWSMLCMHIARIFTFQLYYWDINDINYMLCVCVCVIVRSRTFCRCCSSRPLRAKSYASSRMISFSSFAYGGWIASFSNRDRRETPRKTKSIALNRRHLERACVCVCFSCALAINRSIDWKMIVNKNNSSNNKNCSRTASSM